MNRGLLRIAVVSPYPPPKAKHIYSSGVVSYTKNFVETLRSIDPSKKIEIHVVADYMEGLPKLYVDNNVVVHRIYNKKPLYIFQVFQELCRIKPNVIHIQHEYFLYGGPLTAILFPLLVALSRLICNKVVVTIHGVMPLKLLNNNEFRKENGIHGPTLILKLGLLLVTKLIVLFSNKVIVHELFLKKYLVNNYKEDPYKIVVIPHGVEELSSLPKDEAKRKLGLKDKTVLLYFGYLTGYKGLKELLDMYKEITRKVPNTVLVIAGGFHPRLVREKWYRDWVHNLIKKARTIQQEIKNRGKIIFTGYVEESEISLYFSATDIVILPYKARIAASGPESLAISFEKPYIITTETLDKRELLKEIITVLGGELEKLRKKSKYLKEARKWYNVVARYLRVYQ